MPASIERRVLHAGTPMGERAVMQALAGRTIPARSRLRLRSGDQGEKIDVSRGSMTCRGQRDLAMLRKIGMNVDEVRRTGAPCAAVGAKSVEKERLERVRVIHRRL